MTRETTNRQVQEMYQESDGNTKRRLEELANSISQFRNAVQHIAERSDGKLTVVRQLELAKQRRQVAQRRTMMEWAVAMSLCAAMAAPGVGYFRSYQARAHAQQQAQVQKQREADAALLDQVTDEISEAVPDSMQPLAAMDTEYAGSSTLSSEDGVQTHETR